MPTNELLGLWTLFGQCRQGLVHGQDQIALVVAGRLIFDQFQLSHFSPMLEPLFSAGIFDQNPPHRLRRRPKKMPPAIPLPLPTPDL